MIRQLFYLLIFVAVVGACVKILYDVISVATASVQYLQ